MNGNQHPPGEPAAPAALPALIPAAPSDVYRNGGPHAPQAYAPRSADGGAAQVMLAYLSTMDQFLRVQGDVMRAYLAGQGPAGPGMALAPLAGEPYAQLTAVPLAAEPHAPAPAAAPPAAPQVAAPQALAAPAPAQPAPAPPAGRAALERQLVAITSEKTGYPPEMLSASLALEAELGIDSIKRIEILGAFQQASGMQLEDRMEELAACRTIGELAELLAGAQGARAEVPPGKAEALRQDQALRAEYVVSLEAFPLLRDHTLGREVARTDPGLGGLPLVPLTLSMELLARAAAPLAPGLLVVGMRDVRARRWLTLEGGPVRLEAGAERRGDGVFASLRRAGDAGEPDVEGLVLFAERYPEPPAAQAAPGGAGGRWAPARLYVEAMFHGPAFRGVRSLDAVGAEGATATVEALPRAGLGQALTDPVLLDQPGQVVGFWAAQRMERGQMVFPFHVGELELYGPPPEPGAAFACRARIAAEGELRLRSTLDLVDRAGRLYARLRDWENRRFALPQAFQRLILDPAASALSAPWPLAHGVSARRVALADYGELLTEQGAIWLAALAWLVLGRRERALWAELRTPARRRAEWLLARVAAKEAARELLAARDGLRLCPADIEILPDAAGAPRASGAWTETARAPLISIAHAGGWAAAAVADGPELAGVGLDIEVRDRLDGDVAALVFGAGERALLAELPEEWAVRAWCAKEALGKALGVGLRGGPQALAVRAVDARSGLVTVEPHGAEVWTRAEHGVVAAVATVAADAAPQAAPAPGSAKEY